MEHYSIKHYCENVLYLTEALPKLWVALYQKGFWVKVKLYEVHSLMCVLSALWSCGIKHYIFNPGNEYGMNIFAFCLLEDSS